MYRHDQAFDPLDLETDTTLDSIGCHRLRSGPDKEDHMYNPADHHRASARRCARAAYEKFQRIHRASGRRDQAAHAARACWSSTFDQCTPVPLEEVESARAKSSGASRPAPCPTARSLRRRTSAWPMAMNRLGGQAPTRARAARRRERLGTDARTAQIKQVASGRFGVTSEYLVSAEEIQIKMAQGAKPGEGGHLPGQQGLPVDRQDEVFHARREPDFPAAAPRHLLHRGPGAADLRPEERQPPTRASPSSWSVRGGGGHGGGGRGQGGRAGDPDFRLRTAAPARPRSTSIHNAGLPWELGVAEAHQTLSHERTAHPRGHRDRRQAHERARCGHRLHAGRGGIRLRDRAAGVPWAA